ncbi:MAG: hypothetical protein JJE30_06520 [Desulfuromonadales bacterium]|nr:hypothetical protein [Desulfuromonadales bacterium]
MKRILVIVAIVAASVSYSKTALSDEYASGQPNDYGQVNTNQIKGQKDECLIVAKNCINDNETVMQRVERLNREINKGTDVYTPEELRILQNQLNWINSDSAEYSGGRY